MQPHFTSVCLLLLAGLLWPPAGQQEAQEPNSVTFSVLGLLHRVAVIAARMPAHEATKVI